MAITASQAQGLVLALFGASAGGHLTGLTGAASLTDLAHDLSTSAGLILDKDLSSNTAFRDLVLTTNLKLTGTALTEAQAWMDGEFTKGTSRADILAAAVTFLDGLTDTTNVFYATAAAYRTTVADAVTWSTGAGATEFGVAALRGQQGHTEVVVGQSFTLTTGTTDLLIGTAGNDTFSGASTTFQSTDRIVDASATDTDTLNLTGLTADASPNVSGVELINVNFASTAARVLNLGAAAGANLAATNNVSGVTNLTVTRDDVVVGGSTILGEKTVNVQYLNADKVAKVTAGAGTKNLTVSQVDKAGVTIDGNVATGDVSVAGAATINVAAAASATGGTVTVTALASGGNASGVTASASTALAENAKPVTVNAAVAKGITLANGGGNAFTGAIAITAPEALFVTVPAGSGGVTVNAAKGASIVDANGVALNVQTGIDVRGISSKGADITTGAYAAKTNGVASAGQITIGGTAATSDKATVSAAGSISLTVNQGAQVDKVTLKGNGAAVTYTVGANADAGAATTAYTLAGDQNVTLSIAAAKVSTATVTDATDGKTTTLKLTSTGTATYDLSAVSVDNLLVSSSATSSVFTVASGTTVQLGADQTTSVEVAGVAAGSTLSLQTADDTAASGATIDIVTAELKVTNATKLNIDATVGKLTATKLTAAATTDVVITGNKAVNLDSAGNGTASVAKSIDASALTAALTYSTATSANVTSGSGNDTLKLSDGGNGTAAVTYNTGAGNDAVTITKATKGVTINTDTGNDTVTLTAADSTATVNTGAGNDTINGTTISGVATVDAGDGNDTITIAAAMGAAGSVYIGGTGNDSISISNTNSLVVDAGTGDDTVTVSADVDSVIVGGDGTDTLNISSASDFTTANANDNFAFTGFETVDMTGANGNVTIKASVVSGQTFTLQDDNGAAVFLNGTATANTIDLSGITRVAGATDVGSLTIDADAGNDTVTGTALGETIMGTVGADTLSAGAGTDTISYTGAADNADAGTQTGIVVNLGTTAVTASTIGASGVGVLADSIASVAANTAAYIYASAGATNSANVDTLSGFENITGSAGGDYLVGDANANTINGGDGTDYVIGGAGADIFQFTYGDNAGANGAAVADLISGFVAGTDKLQFTGITDVVSAEQAAVQTAVTALAAGSTDAQIATAMANANATNLGVSFAVFNGNTYVYLEKTGATTTHVEADNIFIKLIGVTTAPTFAADVTA